jgi:hypothetical protein
MTEPGGGFFRNRLMWIGFALAGGLDLMNGLSYLFPYLPHLVYQGADMDIGPSITQHPWNAIGSLRLDFYPFMLGIAFLLPQDLIFSTWFFYLLGKGQAVLGSAFGLTELSPLFPYYGMQSAGAVVVLGLVALWEARSYLGQVWRRALHQPSELDDTSEAMTYRTAVFGFLLTFLWVAGFAVWLGMEPWLILPYFLIFFLVSLTVARLRADTGIPRSSGQINDG